MSALKRSSWRTAALFAVLVVLLIVAVTTPAFRHTPRRAASPQQLVGRPAPSINLPLHGGGTFGLASERGKVVVLDFWATWCVTCIKSMPAVREITAAYAARGVKLVTVNVDDTPARVTAFQSGHNIGAPIVLADETDVAAAYGAWSIPTIAVINAEGVVTFAAAMTAEDVGQQLPAAIESALAKPPEP
jgi:thiol-disulfide isomerase/thioredoxin